MQIFLCHDGLSANVAMTQVVHMNFLRAWPQDSTLPVRPVPMAHSVRL